MKAAPRPVSERRRAVDRIDDMLPPTWDELVVEAAEQDMFASEWCDACGGCCTGVAPWWEEQHRIFDGCQEIVSPPLTFRPMEVCQ